MDPVGLVGPGGGRSMRYERLKERLSAGETIILGGPTGTELQRRGAPMDPAAWSAPTTLGHDRLLAAVHANYIDAGADVITANTFASSRLLLAKAGLADRVREINERAVEAALRARDATTNGATVVIAGSLSHWVPLESAATEPAQSPSDAEIENSFHELGSILAAAGCELIILEMRYHPARVRAALRAALAAKIPVSFGASARRGRAAKVISYYQPEEVPLEAVATLIPETGVDAAGDHAHERGDHR